MAIHVHFPQWLTTAKVHALKSLSHLKVLWKVWDLRTFILLSLTLQTILILFAPLRKRSANVLVIVSIWLAYLLADYIAYQAVGLIPNYSDKVAVALNSTTAPSDIPHPDLLAFWSPFLLVHLGGPDTITALALEDNELWMRTALHLCTQVSATGRVFFQSLQSNILWLPTILMFIAGILKYLERTLSLFYARLTKFKSSMLTDPDPGPNYAKLMESYDSYLNSALPAKFDTNPEPDQYKFAALADIELEINEDDEEEEEEQQPDGNGGQEESTTTGLSSLLRWFKSSKQNTRKLSNVQQIRDAFEYFEKYKGLYVDLIFSFHDRNKSRVYFLKRSAKDAFKVLEIELNFTYEVFFTKMVVIHQTFGTVIRYISVACEVLSLLIWFLFIEKKIFHRVDIRITYTLLWGAISLDAIAAFRVVLSDWKVAMLNKESERRAFFYDWFLSIRNRSWGRYWGSKESPYLPFFRRIFFRRWSESVLQFNLIDYCVDPWSTGSEIFFKIIPLKDKFEGLYYVSKKWFADDLRDFIFSELQYKSRLADDPRDAEEICNSRGDWVLRSLAALDFNTFDFYPWTADVEYDECLLLWHVATELLYQDELGPPAKKTQEESFWKRLCNCIGSEAEEKKEKTEEDYRKYCKTLSDYMMYLLNRQPEMMFAVAGINEVRFRDTCAEATKFFERVLPKATKDETKEVRHYSACERIMRVNTDINPKEIKGDRSKSVLFDACRLAKRLKKIKEQGQNAGERQGEEDQGGVKAKRVGMWELMAKVWVELVSYSAVHVRANAHAAQLKQGGELLTLVWLLMVHLGLGTQFRITQGNARSKLILNK